MRGGSSAVCPQRHEAQRPKTFVSANLHGHNSNPACATHPVHVPISGPHAPIKSGLVPPQLDLFNIAALFHEVCGLMSLFVTSKSLKLPCLGYANATAALVHWYDDTTHLDRHPGWWLFIVD